MFFKWFCTKSTLSTSASWINDYPKNTLCLHSLLSPKMFHCCHFRLSKLIEVDSDVIYIKILTGETLLTVTIHQFLKCSYIWGKITLNRDLMTNDNIKWYCPCQQGCPSLNSSLIARIIMSNGIKDIEKIFNGLVEKS